MRAWSLAWRGRRRQAGACSLSSSISQSRGTVWRPGYRRLMQLTDAQWARIAPLILTPRGNCKLPARQVLEAWLFVTKEGCSWRALPERFGPWHTVYMRGRRWIDKGVWSASSLSYDALNWRRRASNASRTGRCASRSTARSLRSIRTGAPRKRGARSSSLGQDKDRPLAQLVPGLTEERLDDQAARARAGRPAAADHDPDAGSLG